MGTCLLAKSKGVWYKDYQYVEYSKTGDEYSGYKNIGTLEFSAKAILVGIYNTITANNMDWFDMTIKGRKSNPLPITNSGGIAAGTSPIYGSCIFGNFTTDNLYEVGDAIAVNFQTTAHSGNSIIKLHLYKLIYNVNKTKYILIIVLIILL